LEAVSSADCYWLELVFYAFVCDKPEYSVLTKGDNEETNSQGIEYLKKSEYKGKVLFWIKILS